MSEAEETSLWGLTKQAIRRRLQPGEPSTFVEGGGNLDEPTFTHRERDPDRLADYEAAYKEGGPVSQLVDTRALMTFGTGSEFVTEDQDATITRRDGDDPGEAEELTVADWLDEQFPQRDNTFVQIARHNYIYGDWFGELVTNRGGGFSHLVDINPKTVEVYWDDQGQIDSYQQTIKRGPREISETFDADEIAHIALYKLGRNPLGVSLIGRNWDEVTRYHDNQKAIAHALEMHAFVKWHVQAGREGQVLDDTELRRIRQRFNKIRNNDTYITGPDVDIDPLDTGGIGEGIGNITENDLTNLASSFGVPEEMAGLGRGSTEATAKVRLQAFERSARAEQRALADQFVEQVVRPVLADSPFPDDIHVTLEFDDVVSDQKVTAEWLREFKDTYTVDEIRHKLGDGPVPDEVDLDGDEVPAQGQEGGGGAGGIFDGALAAGDTPLGHDHGRALLTSDGHQDWEAAWHGIIEHALWSSDPQRQLFGGFDDERLPEFAKERLREAITGGDALFSDFETVPDAAREAVRATMLDSLETQHGWSIQSITNNLQDAVDLSEDDAERIARTETQSVVAHAREAGYRDRLEMDEARFDWVGPSDGRTTDACEWIKAQIPDEGVTMDRLKELIQEAPEHDADINTEPREFTPHINCRHQFVRRV